jgi:hypothetical protein
MNRKKKQQRGPVICTETKAANGGMFTWRTETEMENMRLNASAVVMTNIAVVSANTV